MQERAPKESASYRSQVRIAFKQTKVTSSTKKGKKGGKKTPKKSAKKKKK